MMARRALHGLAALALTGAAALGCTETELPDTQVECSPADDSNFRPVSRVLELRCGTLDCHGSMYRPLRIFGQQGLRRPEPEDSTNIPPGQYRNYYSGGTVPTTAAELQDNADAICGLEPELLKTFREAVVKGGDRLDLAGELTIVRKARLEERHKGGKIWDVGKPGDQCLINWLSPPDPQTGVNTAPCGDLL